MATLPLLLPICLSAQPSAAIHTTVEYDKKIRAAIEAYDQGKLQEAEPLLRSLVGRYPQSYELNEALGGLYAETGEADRALSLLVRACRLAPREPVAHANLGATYLKLGRNTEAVRELERAASLDPKNGETLANLGQSLIASGKPKEAAGAFSRAADALPAQPELRYNSALAYYKSGVVKQADTELRRIPEASRGEQAHSLLAEVDERLGQYKEAISEYQAAAQINPSEENLYALTAELLRHWTWTEAIQIADFGASRYPASKRLKVAGGVARYANNDYKGAAPVFADLLQQEPENATFADLLGRSCSLLTDGQEAGCGGIYEFAQRHPGNAVTTTYAAVAILHEPREKQNLDEAERLLKEAMAADPKYAEAYFQMGVLDQTRLQWKESVEMLDRSIALRPRASQAHYRLSRAYSHLGRREEAQTEMTLQRQLSQQEKDSLNAKMQEVVTFLLKPS